MGAILLTTVGSSILFGIITIQVYIYYFNFPSDRWYQKFFVTNLLLLSTALLVLDIHNVYHYLITDFGNIFQVEFLVWSVKLQCVFDVRLDVVFSGLLLIAIFPDSTDDNRALHSKASIDTLIRSESVDGRKTFFSRLAMWIIVVAAYVLGVCLITEVYKMRTWIDLNRMHVKPVHHTSNFAVMIDQKPSGSFMRPCRRQQLLMS
ncbi:hypothetical protein BDZ97DRAFT_1918005 [Flammula alnicola]|nr:hypothetical protein BDZ97DRAFT_1918005 [Flammula alnicola]